MKSCVGTGEGRARKSVCCVGMSVRECCGNVQHIELTFCRICRNALEIVFLHFETMNRSDKASFVFRSELWEEHSEFLLALVKEYIIGIWEERKSRLYGDNACAHQPCPQSPTGDLGDIAGQNGK